MVESNNIDSNPPLTVEITVISAQALNNSSSLSSFFSPSSKRLKPFATLTPATLSSPWTPPPEDAELHSHARRTKTDGQGGRNPRWGDTFQVPFPGSSFLYGGAGSPSVLLRVHGEGLGPGRTLLGWCHVPMADILWPPTGSVRLLSYRLRARDGSRSHGVVNLATRLQGLPHQDPIKPAPSPSPSITYQGPRPAIGIPVSTLGRAPAASHSKLRYD